jgi:hypothetical protein
MAGVSKHWACRERRIEAMVASGMRSRLSMASAERTTEGQAALVTRTQIPTTVERGPRALVPAPVLVWDLRALVLVLVRGLIPVWKAPSR